MPHDSNGNRINRWLFERLETPDLLTKAIKLYCEFRGMNEKELLEEKRSDLQRSTKKQGCVEDQIKRFYKYLTLEYQRENKKPGLVARSALAYVAAVIEYYRLHKLPLQIEIAHTFWQGLAGGMKREGAWSGTPPLR